MKKQFLPKAILITCIIILITCIIIFHISPADPPGLRYLSSVFKCIFLPYYRKFPGAGGRFHRYAFGGNYSGGLALSADGSKIVFSSPRTGHGDMYCINVDRTNRRRLTFSEDYEGDPNFSPDGSKIAYIRENSIQKGEIYIMNADGTKQTRITVASGYSYDEKISFSPDGKQIVFYRRDPKKTGKGSYWRGELYVVNIDGTGLKRITNNNITESCVHFSSNSKKIFYHVYEKDETWETDLETLKSNKTTIMPMDRTNVKKFTLTTERRIDLTISSDGSKIAYLSDEGSGVGTIYVMNSDGSSVKPVGKNY